jgi:hypothetical protein
MIQENELRIGNWMNINGYPYQLSRLDFAEYLCDDFDPILLTPEILEKFGLNGTKIDFEKSIKINVSLSNNVVYIGNATSTSGTVVKDIKYLHQLQNLYFALTGKELVEVKQLQES